MRLTVELSLKEILRQVLDDHDPYVVLHTIGELENCPDPAHFADKSRFLLPKYPELWE